MMLNRLFILIGFFLSLNLHAAEPIDLNIPRLAYNSSASDIQKYERIVNDWNDHPKVLDSLSGQQLFRLCAQVGCAPAKGEMSNAQWLRLRDSDTRLMGFILASQEERIDASINIDRAMGGPYLPYDYVATNAADQDNPAKRAAYEAQVRAGDNLDKREYKQIVLHKQLDELIFCVSCYLDVAYSDKAEKIHNALPVLRKAQVSEEIIAKLIDGKK